MRFSENQLEAVKTRNKNILVSASAGSGKTAVLTERVTDIIKNGGSIDSLLVVTFTRLAAAEMKSRIEHRITELLKDPKEKNKEHLRKQLRLINSAEITTIDAFCGRLVRRFFYKTDIAPNFKAVPESSLLEIRTEAMDRVIDKAFKSAEAGEELYSRFYDLCDMVSGKGTGSLELENEIIGIYNNISSMPYPEAWLRETKKSFEVNSYEEYIALPFCGNVIDGTEIKYAAELAEEADNRTQEWFDSDILNEDTERFRRLVKEKNPLKLIERLNGMKYTRWESGFTKAEPEISKRIQDIRDKAKKIVKASKEECRIFSREAYEIYKNHLPFLRLFYTLAEDFFAEYYKLKSEKNMYEFSDIERACLNMLVDEKGCETETAAYLKNRYTEILTDEYQDTNPLQEEILKALSKDSNRFMVGDIKQSIYGFRNAEPEIFAKKYLSFYDDESGKNKLVSLTENYRSVPEILDFVNTVFSRIMTRELGGTEYEAFKFPENSPLKGLKGNKVQISILNRTTEFMPPEEYTNEETPILMKMMKNAHEAEALLVAKKIKELMAEDETVGYGDIAILLRAVEGVADSYVSVFEKCGIPVLTDKPADSTSFIENKVILSFIRSVDNPFSDIDVVTVLHSPIYRLTIEELGLIKLEDDNRDVSFYELVRKYVKEHTDGISLKLNDFLAQREYFETRFKTEPVNAVLSEIYSKTDYYSYLNLMTDSKKRKANLDKLLDMAQEYDENFQGGLYGFLNYIDSITNGKEFKQAQVLTAENNAVRIMSIHKSKGLQFPVVFLSHVQGKFVMQDRRHKIVFDKDRGICMEGFDPKERIINDTVSWRGAIVKNNRETVAEGMREYYVAMTRAEKRLYIIASDTAKNKDIMGYGDEIEALAERYENPLMVSSKIISAETVYSANNFFNVLMSALYGSKSKSYEVEFLNWFKLGGILKDGKKEIYKTELPKRELKKTDYLYKAYTTLPTNMSVTEIKRKAGEEEYTMAYRPRPFVLKKPDFIKKSENRLSPMEEGTACHAVLSALDYNNLPSDAAEFKQGLLKKGVITEQEAEAVKDDKIAAYIKSPLAERAAKALYVKKEHSFTLGLLPKEIYPDFEGDEDGDIILTHGIIDMFFEEPDGIVIVDFKTDKSEDHEGLKKMYYPQLSVYKTAVEEAAGKKVKEMLLYLVVQEKVLKL